MHAYIVSVLYMYFGMPCMLNENASGIPKRMSCWQILMHTKALYQMWKKEARLQLPRKSMASNRQAGYVNYLRNISPLFYYNIMSLSVLVFIWQPFCAAHCYHALLIFLKINIWSDDQNKHRVRVCEDMLEWIGADPDFLGRIITGDESWVFQYDPETKRQSQQWTTPNSPWPKKARMSKSKIKTMLTTFFDQKGLVHREFVPRDQAVNQHFY